jgi:hypothetical protein
MYDANCQLLPIDHWRIGSLPLPDVKNTPASRATTYVSYDQQALCVQKQMQEIFSVMRKAHIYNETIVIVHGDHGSRIALHEPYIENKDIFTQQDFQDYFPALFAVKAPGYAVGNDNQLTDLQTVLAGVVRGITGDIIAVPKEAPYIYLTEQQVGLPMAKIVVKQLKKN